MSISPARAVAFEILLRVEQQNSYASELLHSDHYAGLKPADHGLATELVMGVLRWRSSLDAEIGAVSSQPLQKLDPEVLIALRLAVYQLRWLDRIPARASIHESVELVKRARKHSAAPFANAVLRKLTASRAIGDGCDDTLRSASTVASLAEASAHPQWLVERWAAQLGFQAAHNICTYDQTVPATSIRLRGRSEDELRREQIELAGGALMADARKVVSGDITRTRACAQSRIVVQDEASQLVAALVGNGARILDCCAAPGGKTWAIADRNPDATIVAVELHPHRADVIRKRVATKKVQVITGDVRTFTSDQPFDRVLVDVPCSGTGTLARNPEIKWRLKPEDLADLRSRQLLILESSMRQVARNGKLIYSTCSLEPEEDESVIEQALRTTASFRLADSRTALLSLQKQGELVAANVDPLLFGPYIRTIPGVFPCDGFFIAILERVG